MKVINKYGIHKLSNSLKSGENIDIYQQAFIHSSYRRNEKLIEEVGIVEKPEGALDIYNYDYERLEFLGDSILGAIVANYLYERYYNQNEGFLSVMKTKLVRKHALAYFSKELGFSEYIILSRHMPTSSCLAQRVSLRAFRGIHKLPHIQHHLNRCENGIGFER